MRSNQGPPMSFCSTTCHYSNVAWNEKDDWQTNNEIWDNQAKKCKIEAKCYEWNKVKYEWLSQLMVNGMYAAHKQCMLKIVRID